MANFLGSSGTSEVALKKLAWPVPTLSIQGPANRLTTHSASLRLKAFAKLPNTGCVGDSDLVSARMSFQWSEPSRLYSGSLSGTSKNPRMLNLPARALTAGQNYTFEVLGWLTDDPTVNNTAHVVVEVQPEDLVPRISGRCVAGTDLGEGCHIAIKLIMSFARSGRMFRSKLIFICFVAYF